MMGLPPTPEETMHSVAHCRFNHFNTTEQCCFLCENDALRYMGLFDTDLLKSGRQFLHDQTSGTDSDRYDFV